MLYGWILLATLWFFFLRIFPIKKETDCYFIKKEKPYEQLILQMIQYDEKKNVPSYKFYDSLFQELLVFQKKFGISIKSSIQELRVAINKDIKSEKRVGNIKLNSVVQYISMCFFTWFFLFYMSQSLRTVLDSLDLISILVWQLIGIYSFKIVLKKFEFYYTKPFEFLFRSLYQVKCYLNSSQPLQLVKSTIEKSFRTNNNSAMKVFETRIHHLLVTIKETGSIDPNELDCLIQEGWDSYELALEKFEKSLIGLKLILFLLFIIPSYLYSITLAVGQIGI